MSTTTTTPTSTPRPELLSYISWGALIVCPIIVLLPPRKLDIYTLGLLGTTFLGGNQISREYTGVSMVQRMSNRAMAFTDSELPVQARETQRRMREEKAIRDGKVMDLGRQEGSRSGNGNGEGKVLGEIEARRKIMEEEEGGDKGMLEKIWMGSEGEDWKAKRDKREKEALEEGKGYGGLIMDQIWEVWSWGKDKNEEVKRIDERVVEERREGHEEEKRR